MDHHHNRSRKIWIPQDGLQTNVFQTTADVVGLGGEAGGGKSDTMYGLAWYRFPDAIVFRKQFTHFEHRIIPRGREVFEYTGVGKWTGRLKRKFEHARGFLELGAMEFPDSYTDYRGSEWSGMFFDEVTDMLKSNVLNILTWNRSQRRNQKCQAFMYFNPPRDEAGEWVVEYFGPWIDSEYEDHLKLGRAEEGEIRYFITYQGETAEVKTGDPVQMPDGVWVRPRTRTFYRSKTAQNKYLDEDYQSQLRSLPPPMDQQMGRGDFDIGRNRDLFQVIPTAWVDAAMERHEQMDRPDTPMKGIGVDVARTPTTNADTVLAMLYEGDWFDELVVVPGDQTPDGYAVKDLVDTHRRDNCVINIDMVGIGASPFDIMVRAGYWVVGLSAAKKSDGFDRSGKLGFSNLRSELWWRFREALDPDQGSTVALPKNRRLRRELCTPRWKENSNGLQVESKDDIRRRLGEDMGSSTDMADAVIMAWHSPYGQFPTEVSMGRVKAQ